MDDLYKAVVDLTKEYESAKKTEYVIDPLCYALYKTWGKYDLERRRKNADSENTKV